MQEHKIRIIKPQSWRSTATDSTSTSTSISLAAILSVPVESSSSSTLADPSDSSFTAKTHKNFVFFPELAQRFPHATIRFDFQGAGESDGESNLTGYWDDLDDLRFLTTYLINRNWKIHTIIGHSRGSNIALLQAISNPHIAHYTINISARNKLLTGLQKRFQKELTHHSQHGYFEIKYRRRGVETIEKVSKPVEEILKDWERLENEIDKVCYIPRSHPVLSIHGTNDDVVPVNDVATFASSIQNHSLRLVVGGNHNFTGTDGETGKSHASLLCDVILEWISLQECERGFREFWRRFWGVGGVDGRGRVLDVEGVKNFRDFGGYPVGNGVWVKTGVLYRCADPGKATEAGLHTMKALGIKTLYDLRSRPELEKNPPKPELSSHGMSRQWTPVFTDVDYSPAALGLRWKLYTEGPDGFSKAYKQILNTGATAFKSILIGIAEMVNNSNATASPSSAVAIHCTAGKDRTGVIVAVLLSCLGVDDNIVCHDYAVSEGLLKYTDEEMKRHSDSTGGVVTVEGIRSMLSAK
ncbi:hypothetical protein HDU76_002903 [Blyttiomyces sp. JEL0837]|nr:hypothetical protein HDU76_002903 [Blyttiomyces sp. JEL0837]